MEEFFSELEKYRISRGLSRRQLTRLIWPNKPTDEKAFKTCYQNLSNYLNGKNKPYPHNIVHIKKWWESKNGKR